MACIEEGVQPSVLEEEGVARQERQASSRHAARATGLAAVAAALAACAALALSVRHAYDVGARVTRLHVSAPDGADTAALLLHADLAHPRRSPHGVRFHSARCRVRARGVDSLVEVPDIRYQSGPPSQQRSSVSMEAVVRAAPDGEAEREPGCEIASSVDLFGSGLVVPRTIFRPLPEFTGGTRARLARVGMPSWQRSENSTVDVAQAANLIVQVPAGSLHPSLVDLLSGAHVTIDGGVTYSEGDGDSFSLTKTIRSKLHSRSDSQGGLVLSAPVAVSGAVRPSALASTVAQAMVGGRPRPEAPEAEPGSVDRSLLLVAGAPGSPAARLLGPRHVLGWRSQSSSAVNDVVRHARHRLGRRLASRLPGAEGPEAELPALERQGRRLLAGGKTTGGRVTFHETFFNSFDNSRSELFATAVFNEHSIDVMVRFTEDEREEQQFVSLAANFSEDSCGLAHLNLTAFVEGYSAQADFSLDDDRAFLFAQVNDSNSVEVFMVNYSNDATSVGLDLVANLPTDGDFELAPGEIRVPLADVSANGVKDGSSTSLDFSAEVNFRGRGNCFSQSRGRCQERAPPPASFTVSGHSSDTYGAADAFLVEAVVADADARAGAIPFTSINVTLAGTHANKQLDVVANFTSEGQSLYVLNPLVVTYPDTQYSIHTIVKDRDMEQVARLDAGLSNEGLPVELDLCGPTMSDFSLRFGFDIDPQAAGQPTTPCLQGACNLSVELRDSVLDLDFYSQAGVLGGELDSLTASVDAQGLSNSWLLAADLHVSANNQTLSVLNISNELSNQGQDIQLDQFNFDSIVYVHLDREVLNWTINVDLDPRSLAAVGEAIMDCGRPDSFRCESVGVAFDASIQVGDNNLTTEGNVSLHGDHYGWSGFWEEDEPASTTAAGFALSDATGRWIEANGWAEHVESTGTSTVNVSFANHQDPIPVGGVNLRCVDFGQEVSTRVTVIDNVALTIADISASVLFGSAPNRLLNDWSLSLNAVNGSSPEARVIGVSSLSLTAQSSDGTFSSELLARAFSGETIESWSLNGTSSLDFITASGLLNRSMANLTVSFSKPGGDLTEISGMRAAISADLPNGVGGKVVVNGSVGLSDNGIDGSASVVDGDERILDSKGELNAKWLAVTTRFQSQQDVFDSGEGMTYEHLNMSIFGVRADDGLWEAWQESYVQDDDRAESFNLSSRFDGDTLEVSQAALKMLEIRRDFRTREWRIRSNATLAYGSIVDDTVNPGGGGGGGDGGDGSATTQSETSGVPSLLGAGANARAVLCTALSMLVASATGL